MNSDVLLERLAQEIGVGITNREMLKLQLETAQAQTQAALTAKLEADAGMLTVGAALRAAQLEVEALQIKLGGLELARSLAGRARKGRK